VGEIQAHHTGWVIRARLLARSGTILPDGDDSDRSRDARGRLELLLGELCQIIRKVTELQKMSFSTLFEVKFSVLFDVCHGEER
jgi:hypothetical protein